MIVKSGEFQNNVGKYMKLAEKDNIIITKNGKPIIKLVPAKEETPLLDEILSLTSNNGEIKSLDVDDKELRNERLQHEY